MKIGEVFNVVAYRNEDPYFATLKYCRCSEKYYVYNSYKIREHRIKMPTHNFKSV